MPLEVKPKNTVNQIFKLDKKTEFGFLASEINQKVLSTYIIPNQIRDEIPTLNKFGYMKIDLDEFTQDFIEYVAQSNTLCLELGTAYGFVALQVLEKNCRIIASDISQEHLEVLMKTARADQLKNLYLYPGKFPDEINFPSNSIGAVLTSRMIHFLNSKEIEDGLKKIYNWLIPGGKFYFVAVTPYHEALREKFLPIYEERTKEGNEWPGEINSQWEIAPQHKAFVPEFLQVFDAPQLEVLLPKHGFKIEKIKLFDYPNELSSGSKGHIGFVASKI